VAFCWLVRVVLLINQQGFVSKKAKAKLITKRPLVATALASLAGSHITQHRAPSPTKMAIGFQ
jgi:hypothetical protein